MTVKELKELDDKDIRKFAYEALYANKKLSNTNVDCFVSGFKVARNKVNTEMADSLKSIVDAIKKNVTEIEMTAGYGGRGYTSEKITYIHQIQDVQKDTEALLGKIKEYKIGLTL